LYCCTGWCTCSRNSPCGKAGYASARNDVIRLEGLSGHKDYQAYQQNDKVWIMKSTKKEVDKRHGLSKEVE
jgi:hypothetical protein